MHSQLVCALCAAAFVTAWVPAAEAQSKPATEQTSLSVSERPIAIFHFSQNLKSTSANNGHLRDQASAEVEHLKTLLAARRSDTGAEAPTCGHILIYSAPVSDSKMIIEVPKESFETMPAFPNLPPCQNDFRPRLMSAQIPPSWKTRPAGNDSLPRDTQKPQMPIIPK